MKLKRAFVYTPSVVACAVLSWNHTHLLFNDRPSNTEYHTYFLLIRSELVKPRFVFFYFFTCEGRRSLTRWEQRGVQLSPAAVLSKPGTHTIKRSITCNSFHCSFQLCFWDAWMHLDLLVHEREKIWLARESIISLDDSWLHLKLINKLCLALRPTSILRIQYYTTLHILNSNTDWVGYAAWNTDINSEYFTLIKRCSFAESNSAGLCGLFTKNVNHYGIIMKQTSL